MRFNQHSCNRCAESCHGRAISIQNGLEVTNDTCSGCMLCVSACPSGCFEIRRLDFYSVLSRLKGIPSPVLGCSDEPCVVAHEKTCCLGFLSEEHLMALSAFLQQPVQINLTACAACKNGFIVEVLKGRLETIHEKTSAAISKNIVLVEEEAELVFRDVFVGRRTFFKTIKTLAMRNAAALFPPETPKKGVSAYSGKKVPFRRALLNRILPTLSGETYGEVLKHFYYTASVDRLCDDCFSCVAACPSGAFTTEQNESEVFLLHKSSLCTGCGLCVGFCMNKAIQITPGYAKGSPHAFSRIKKENTSRQVQSSVA